MKKKIIALLIVIVILVIGVFQIHNSFMDRINPLIPETTSYAKVKKGTQTYKNVQAIDPKTGKNLSYKIKEIIGYDPQGEYIKIVHKGQYVNRIAYISKTQYSGEK